jgi:hypothetical protein
MRTTFAWLLASTLAMACPATASAELLAKPPGPLSAEGIEQLCNAVSDQILSDKGVAFAKEHDADGIFPPAGQGMYAFEVILTSAAGVAAGDSPEQVKAKLQRYWLEHRTRLGCSQLGFSIRQGNVVKLAFERHSKIVIADFLRRWSLDMNFIDPADGKTVLDYVEGQLAESRGQPIEGSVRRNFDLLVRSGAKRAAEL